jgi:hypothetical protein
VDNTTQNAYESKHDEAGAKEAPFGYQMQPEKRELFASIFADIAHLVDNYRHSANLSEQQLADTATPVAFLLSMQAAFASGNIAFKDAQAIEDFYEGLELLRMLVTVVSDPIHSAADVLRGVAA